MRQWTKEQAKALAHYRQGIKQMKATGKQFVIVIDPKLFPASIPMKDIQKACEAEDCGYIDVPNDEVKS
jgi:hypothetical protein